MSSAVKSSGRPRKPKFPPSSQYVTDIPLDYLTMQSGPSSSQATTARKRPKGSTGISGKRRPDGMMIVKGNWTEEEDNRLKMLVRRYLGENGDREDRSGETKGTSTRWSEIAKELPGRVGKQCRERWHNHLRPDINKGRWSIKEEVVIFICWRVWGSQWARIARILQGRSDNRVKNHWNCHMKRRLTRDDLYVDFLKDCYSFAVVATDAYIEDRREDARFLIELLARIDQFMTDNAEKVKELPEFFVPKKGKSQDAAAPQDTDIMMMFEEGTVLSNDSPSPQRKARKVRKRHSGTHGTSDYQLAAKLWDVHQPNFNDQTLETNEENNYLYTAQIGRFSQHFSGSAMSLYCQEDRSEMDMFSGADSPSHSHARFCDPQTFQSPVASPQEDYEPPSDDGIRTLSYGCDPLWSKAVTADFSSASPKYHRNGALTSTPLKQTSAFNVPLAAECGVHPYYSPMTHRDFMGFTPPNEGFPSPIGRYYADKSSFFEEPSMIAISPMKGFGNNYHRGEESPWTPVKLGSMLVRTPQPIREALAQSDVSRRTISPEDLASPGRLFSDASELIDGELNRSGDLLHNSGRMMNFSGTSLNPLRTPDMALSKCRRRLTDQWNTNTGTPTSSTSFVSSGYGSFHTTPI